MRAPLRNTLCGSSKASGLAGVVSGMQQRCRRNFVGLFYLRAFAADCRIQTRGRGKSQGFRPALGPVVLST